MAPAAALRYWRQAMSVIQAGRCHRRCIQAAPFARVAGRQEVVSAAAAIVCRSTARGSCEFPTPVLLVLPAEVMSAAAGLCLLIPTTVVLQPCPNSCSECNSLPHVPSRYACTNGAVASLPALRPWQLCLLLGI